MHKIIKRNITATIIDRLLTNSAVALLGARQVGKSTIAGMIIEKFPDAIYLDLERPADLNKLTDPEAFFQQFKERLKFLLSSEASSIAIKEIHNF